MNTDLGDKKPYIFYDIYFPKGIRYHISTRDR